MPAFDRQPKVPEFIRQLEVSLRYAAGVGSVEEMIRSLSIEDTNERNRPMRMEVADALSKDGRHSEAKLLKGHRPVYVTGAGEIRPRQMPADAEYRFIRAYIDRLLQFNVDANDKPLHRRFSLKDFDPQFLRRIVKDAIAFANDNAGAFGRWEKIDPMDAAAAHLCHRNGLCGYSYADEDYDHIPQKLRRQLIADAEAAGPLPVAVEDGRIVAG